MWLNSNRRAIGDLGFRGEEALLSVPKAHDSPAVAEFKSRALKRHESFNKLIKDIEITRLFNSVNWASSMRNRGCCTVNKSSFQRLMHFLITA
jgi:hypothetical protein